MQKPWYVGGGQEHGPHVRYRLFVAAAGLQHRHIHHPALGVNKQAQADRVAGEAQAFQLPEIGFRLGQYRLV